MPDLKDFLPDARLSRADERASALAAETTARAERTGLWRAAGDAINSEWASSWAVRQFGRSGYEFDPNFALNDELVKTLGEGLDPDLWESLAPAVSLGHAQRIREQLIDVQASRQRLSEMGVTGSALRIGAAILDPAFIAGSVVAGLATGGVGAAAAAATRVGRLQRLYRGGVLAAATEVPIQSYIASQDPEQGVGTVLWSGAAAFGLGGAISAFGPDLARAARKFRKDIEFGDVINAAMGSAAQRELGVDAIKELEDRILTKDGAIYFKDQLASAKDKRLIVDQIIKRSGLDEVIDADEIAILRELSPDLALNQFGFARVADDAPLPRGDDAIDEIDEVAAKDIETPGTGDGEPPTVGAPPKQVGDFTAVPDGSFSRFWKWARPSMTGKVGKSEVTMMRRAGNAMAQDGVPKKGDAVNHTAASEWIGRTFKRTMARYNREVNTAFDAWAKANNVPYMKRHAARQQFDIEVGKTIRSPKGTYGDPHLNKAANVQRGLQRELLDLAKRHRVKGFDRVQPNDNYLMRVWRQSNIDKVFKAHGEQGAVDMFAGAIVRGSDDIDAEDAKKLAKGFLRAMRKRDEYTELELNQAFAVDNSDMLERILRDNVDNITDEEVERIVYTLKPRSKDANVSSRAQRRVRLDENYNHIFADGSTVNINDLLENNAQTLMNVYARQIIGSSAMNEVYRSLSTGPDDVIENFGHIKARIIREAREVGADADDVKDDLARLEIIYKHNLGLRLNPDTRTNNTMRRLRGANYINLAGQFGWAQVPEMGSIIGEHGIRVMIQQMPAMKHIFKRAADGRLENQLLDFFESFLGVGTDRLNSGILTRLDDIEANRTFGGGGIDTMLERGAKFSNDVSFMAPVNIVLQRTSALAAAQSFVNLAFSRKPLSAVRRASMGLSEEDAAKVFEQIRTHAVTKKGIIGHSLRDINIDAWTDQQAAAKLIDALDRWSRRVVQENDIGNMSMWMTKEWGKTLLQFRTFMAVAWEKQFLHRIATHDWQDFMAVSMAGFFASIAYVGMTYQNSIGRKDREEFLKERLSPAAIGKAAFSRSGFWSPATPLLETANYLAGGDPLFSQARTTGLNAGTFTGNPTFSLAESIGKTGRNIAQSARGTSNFSDQDARTMLNLLPFRNVVGMKNVLDAIGGQFPEPE